MMVYHGKALCSIGSHSCGCVVVISHNCSRTVDLGSIDRQLAEIEQEMQNCARGIVKAKDEYTPIKRNPAINSG